MKNQVLTKAQMDELIALGVDVSKASMCRVSVNIGTPATDESKLVENNVNYYGMSFPVFTVTDMLEMMPSVVRDPFKFGIRIYKNGKYICDYYSANLNVSRYREERHTLVGAVYGCFIQLVKDGKL